MCEQGGRVVGPEGRSEPVGSGWSIDAGGSMHGTPLEHEGGASGFGSHGGEAGHVK